MEIHHIGVALLGANVQTDGQMDGDDLSSRF